MSAEKHSSPRGALELLYGRLPPSKEEAQVSCQTPWSPGLGKDSGRFLTFEPNEQIFFYTKGSPLAELTLFVFILEISLFIQVI